MKNIIFKLIRYTGLPFLFRELLQRRKVSIILYHDINAETAFRTFSYLKKHYNVICLQDYLEARRAGKRLPKKAIIITFDDGYVTNYQLLPILKQLQIPITIFLCSDIVGTHRHFWFTPDKEMISDCQNLKKLPYHVLLEKLKAYGYEPTKEYEDIQALTHEQIEEMRDWVDFQSHTCFHPCLTQCDDKTAEMEITLSKQHLEQDYSFKINTISYPNGDYTLRDIHFAKNAGYTCGITVVPGFNDFQTDLFRLKRLSVNEGQSIDEFIVKASGCYAFMKNVFHQFSK